MRRRGYAEGEMPERLMHYRAGEWSSPEEWWAAWREWNLRYPARSLIDLNERFSRTVFPPHPDPRLGEVGR